MPRDFKFSGRATLSWMTMGLLWVGTALASAGSATFTWSDPNPAGWVIGYRFYTNGVLAATGTGTNCTVNLSAGVSVCTVRFVGPSGLESAASEPSTNAIPARPVWLKRR